MSLVIAGDRLVRLVFPAQSRACWALVRGEVIVVVLYFLPRRLSVFCRMSMTICSVTTDMVVCSGNAVGIPA